MNKGSYEQPMKIWSSVAEMKQAKFLSTQMSCENWYHYNFGDILHQRSCKEAKNFENHMFRHMCQRLPQTDTNTVYKPAPPRQSDVRVDKNVAYLNSLICQNVRK
jgi:hypothetical protein